MKFWLHFGERLASQTCSAGERISRKVAASRPPPVEALDHSDTYRLNTRLHEWFVHMGHSQYAFGFDRDRVLAGQLSWWVDVPDHLAVLYKLTWEGV